LILKHYYKTNKWKVLSDKIKSKANYICEFCGHEKAVEAHHFYYEDDIYNNDSIENLIAVCHKCHKILHADRHFMLDSKNLRDKPLTLALYHLMPCEQKYYILKIALARNHNKCEFCLANAQTVYIAKSIQDNHDDFSNLVAVCTRCFALCHGLRIEQVFSNSDEKEQ